MIQDKYRILEYYLPIYLLFNISLSLQKMAWIHSGQCKVVRWNAFAFLWSGDQLRYQNLFIPVEKAENTSSSMRNLYCWFESLSDNNKSCYTSWESKSAFGKLTLDLSFWMFPQSSKDTRYESFLKQLSWQLGSRNFKICIWCK